MSEWKQLYAEVLDREPPASLSQRVLTLAAATSVADDPKTGWIRRIVLGMVAATAAAAVLFVLALAAHSRSSAPPPAGPPFPAPPPCVATGSAGVDCGPASAVIRSAGAWQVIDQGRCVDHTHLYFGTHTPNGDAPLSLMLGIPPAMLAKGGDARVTDGRLSLASGATESLSGRVVIAPGGNSGAFTAKGHDSNGHPDGTRYAGAWTCRAGNHPAPQTSSHPTRRADRCVEKHAGGYRISCGAASAILWVDGRWQVLFAQNCRGQYHFGNQPNHGLGGRYLWFHADSYGDQALTGKPVQGVPDGGMTVAGTHAAFIGTAIFQNGVYQTGGAFDLNNRGGPRHGYPRADYVGAWTCGQGP